jgi:hypothetical protein
VLLGQLGHAQSVEYPRPAIDVVVYDYANVPAAQLRRAKKELIGIYRSIGIEVTWWEVSPLTAPSAAESLTASTIGRARFVFIKPSRIASTHDRANIAGSAYGVDGRGRVAYVFYDRVKALPVEMLGYVIAHELGHLLLPAGHSPQGLMRASWDMADLQRAQTGWLLFTREQAEAISARSSEIARASSR